MRKNSYDRILRRESKEQYINIVSKSYPSYKYIDILVSMKKEENLQYISLFIYNFLIYLNLLRREL